MLESVLEAVCAALRESGINAVRDYPDGAAAGAAVLCVGTESCKAQSAGLGDYLGIRKGEGGESDTELYGKRLELCLSLEAFCSFDTDNAARECETLAAALEGLLAALPEGLRCQRLETGELRADESLGCYRCESRLFATAYMLAESGGEQGEFLDFTLKGTVKNVS